MKSEKEIVEETIFFKSHCTIENGPKCHCNFFTLTHFHMILPNYLCGIELDPSLVKEPFTTTGESICPCQESHFYTIEISPEGIKFTELEEGALMDNRKIKLPNFRE